MLSANRHTHIHPFFVLCQASGIIQGSWKAEIRHTLANLPHQWYCKPDPSKVCHPTSAKLTTYYQIYNLEADQDAQLQMQYIKNSWCKGNVITTLFLNTQAAFPNMRKEKLIVNMHARNLAPEYCDYINMILTQHQIQLKFDDHISLPFSLENGCCQGCPYPCSSTPYTMPCSSESQTHLTQMNV